MVGTLESARSVPRVWGGEDKTGTRSGWVASYRRAGSRDDVPRWEWGDPERWDTGRQSEG